MDPQSSSNLERTAKRLARLLIDLDGWVGVCEGQRQCTGMRGYERYGAAGSRPRALALVIDYQCCAMQIKHRTIMSISNISSNNATDYSDHVLASFP